MNSLVSVITPVFPPTASYLPEAYRSLLAQRLPDGWAWEWLVQVDGEPDSISELLPGGDSRIHLEAGKHGGPAVARNLALARARGPLVKVLDADDMLCPGVLGRDIGVLCEHPGRVDHLARHRSSA